MSGSEDLDSVAVENFKEYLRIESVQPNCDYSGCVEFLRRKAEELQLPVAVHLVSPGKPVVVISWEGHSPSLPSLLLSSHMDVVPVFRDQWTRDPFAAEEDEQGNIYARGAQDMKCVGVQYLEAVRRLILQNFCPKRTVHLCFTPDEEIGCLGMRDFVQTDAFGELNVGCVMDEGAANPDETFILDYGERTAYYMEITCQGTPGHGSLLLEQTAGEKLSSVVAKLMEKRAEEKRKLDDDDNLSVGDVTSINLTVVSGGVQANVVPPEFKLMFDCRLDLNTSQEQFENWIESVCRQAGDGVAVKYINRPERIEPTPLNDDNIWWVTLKRQFDEMNIAVKPRICPATTDSKHIRKLGIPAFNFSPMNNTELKLHDHNEYLNKLVFLHGIKIYCNIISAMSNV